MSEQIPIDTFVTSGPEETRAVAAELSKSLRPGDLIALHGDLGAGKTVFAQGLARGLGIRADQVVRSPTFTVFQQFDGPTPFLHGDLYRIGDPEEVEALGLLDLLDTHVVAIEWFERSCGLLGTPRVVATLEEVDDQPEHRKITLSWTQTTAG